MRWQAGQPRESTTLAALTSEHPLFSEPCQLCDDLLGNGLPLQLLVLGPEDPEDREKHAAGRWYSARAIALHADCLNPGKTPVITNAH